MSAAVTTPKRVKDLDPPEQALLALAMAGDLTPWGDLANYGSDVAKTGAFVGESDDLTTSARRLITRFREARAEVAT